MRRPWALALDLESILVPELWPALAAAFDLPALARTTRDTADLTGLMAQRFAVCRREGLTLSDLQAVVATLQPLPGAVELLQWAAGRLPVWVLSDVMFELAAGLLPALGYPMLLCHRAGVDGEGYLSAYRVRQEQAKRAAVVALQSLGYRVLAVGDSHNDLTMLQAADQAVWCNAAPAVAAAHPHWPQFPDLPALQQYLLVRTAEETP